MHSTLTLHRPTHAHRVIGVSATRDASCCSAPCICTRIDGYELNNRAMDPSVMYSAS